MSEARLEAQLAEVERRLGNVETTLAQVRDRVISMNLCSAPNTCLRLDGSILDHEKRLRYLEKRDGVILGGCVILQIATVLVVKLF
jgi:hypothetical protein